MYANGKSLNLPAVNMGLVKEGGSFTTVPGSNGNEVDYVASVSAINDAINNWTVGDDTTIKLVCNTVQFKGSESELAKVKDCLGSFSTYFGTGNTGREINVRNGCSLVNGAVVYPGDEFSVNVALSPYTYENGYQEAGSYENGQVVNSMGGGICQVSTTLYNAVIRAELEVTQRAIAQAIATKDDQVVEDTVAALAAPPAPVETPQPQAPQQPSEPQNPSQDTTQNPTQDPTQKPTQEPTQNPTQNPTQDPTQTPNQDSTQNPGSNTNVDGNNQTTVTQ